MGAHLPSGRRGGRGGARAPMADINVTPLVDVMLVLLIIFMVTAPLLVAGIPVNLPESRARALEQDQKPVTLSIDAQGRVFLDEAEVSEADLPQRFAELRERLDPEAQLFLRADTALDYGRVMRVMGELNRAGLNKVALVTTSLGQDAPASAPSSGRSDNAP
ncbi:MAG TPA: protein TolR [Sphingobium sp.]|nr:protein TolR [Sphingobium sp.]